LFGGNHGRLLPAGRPSRLRHLAPRRFPQGRVTVIEVALENCGSRAAGVGRRRPHWSGVARGEGWSR